MNHPYSSIQEDIFESFIIKTIRIRTVEEKNKHPPTNFLTNYGAMYILIRTQTLFF